MRMSIGTVALLSILLAIGAAASPDGRAPTPEVGAREAAQKGIAFLERDALEWQKERKCSTCHHGAMTVWAMAEARTRGSSPCDGSTSSKSVYTYH